MAVVWDLTKRTGIRGSGRTHKYLVTYEVYCDDPRDGPKSIDFEFQTRTLLPEWGEFYEDRAFPRTPPFNEDRHYDYESYLHDIRSEYVKKVFDTDPDTGQQRELYVYETVLEYLPIGEYRLDLPYNQISDVGPTKPTAFPYEWQPVYRLSFSRRYVDRVHAEYGGTFLYPSNGVLDPASLISTTEFPAIGERDMVMNSARVFYDPPLRGTEADLVMRVTNYSPSFWQPNDGTNAAGLVNGAKYDYSGEPSQPVVVPTVDPTFSWNPSVQFSRYIGRVNCKSLLHWDPEAGIGTGRTSPPTAGDYVFWPEYTLKLESLNSTHLRINGMYVFQNDWEFHYREGMPTSDAAEKTGWRDIIPDVSRMERNTVAGEPCEIPIKVGDGIASYEGVRLNGQGQPIVVGGSACEESYWLRWLAEYTADFNDFNKTGEVAFFRWDDSVVSNPTVFNPTADPDTSCSGP